MAAFTFRLEHPDRAALIKIRTFDAASHAVERGRQLLDEWPNCVAVEVSRGFEPIARLTREDFPNARKLEAC